MVDEIIELFKKDYALKQVDVGDYKVVKNHMMKFNISSYQLEGVGCLSVIEMKAMLSLMKMQTIIVTPLLKDSPLFNIDYIKLMKNNILVEELYNTCLENFDDKNLMKVKDKFSFLPETETEPKWYDNIRYPSSIYKKIKGQDEQVNSLIIEYAKAYLKELKNAKVCSKEEKVKASEVYINGLIDKGGPSTDVFNKILGKDKTRDLFTRYIFGTK